MRDSWYANELCHASAAMSNAKHY